MAALSRGVLMVLVMDNSATQQALPWTPQAMYMWLIMTITGYKNSPATAHSSQSGVLLVLVMDNSATQEFEDTETNYAISTCYLMMLLLLTT